MSSKHAVLLGVLLLAACTTAPPASDAGDDTGPTCTPDMAAFATAALPRIERYCGSCHGTTPNFGAPVSLLDPATLVTVRPDGTRLIDRIAARLADGSMPPVGMPRLPETDANALAGWASCGAVTVPPGSGLVSSAPPFLAPVDPPAGLPHIDFLAGDYPVGPDVRDDYHCFTFDAAIDAPAFVRRFEMVFDDTAVLHHLVVLRDVERHTTLGDFDCYDGSGMPAGSQYLYAWAPGQSALEFPDGGLRISPGERFVVQIHYNNGRSLPDVRDSSGVCMYLAPTTGPEYGMVAIGPTEFALPPRMRTMAQSHCTITQESTLIAGLPHMHLLGSAFDESITRADGTHEPLVHLSGWSFGTQLFYSMPTALHPGDVIQTSCTWMNPGDSTVTSGENTTDEMCFDFAYVTPPPPARYCDEGPNDRPTDVGYVPGGCLPAGTATDVPLVRGMWTMAAAPPALTTGALPDARWLLDGIDFYVTDSHTPIGSIDLAATYVLGRGQVVTSGGRLHYDVSQDTVVLTDTGVRFGGPQQNSFAGTLSSPTSLALSCPGSGTTDLDWGIEGDVLTIGFTSTDVPGQTLWPRFHFRRMP